MNTVSNRALEEQAWNSSFTVKPSETIGVIIQHCLALIKILLVSPSPGLIYCGADRKLHPLQLPRERWGRQTGRGDGNKHLLDQLKWKAMTENKLKGTEAETGEWAGLIKQPMPLGGLRKPTLRFWACMLPPSFMSCCLLPVLAGKPCIWKALAATGRYALVFFMWAVPRKLGEMLKLISSEESGASYLKT